MQTLDHTSSQHHAFSGKFDRIYTFHNSQGTFFIPFSYTSLCTIINDVVLCNVHEHRPIDITMSVWHYSLLSPCKKTKCFNFPSLLRHLLHYKNTSKTVILFIKLLSSKPYSTLLVRSSFSPKTCTPPGCQCQPRSPNPSSVSTLPGTTPIGSKKASPPGCRSSYVPFSWLSFLLLV